MEIYHVPYTSEPLPIDKTKTKKVLIGNIVIDITDTSNDMFVWQYNDRRAMVFPKGPVRK